MVPHESGTNSFEFPSSLRLPLRSFGETAQTVLGPRLAGVYVSGSVARGCWQPSRSDVDVLVLVNRACSIDTYEGLLSGARAASVPLDVSVMTLDQADNDTWPTPFECLLKPFDGGRLITKPEGSRDVLLHRQDVVEVGVALQGPEPTAVLRAVPWPLLAQCIDYQWPFFATHFKDPVLMFCRAAYTYSERALCSKAQAGEWALTALPRRWTDLVRAAQEACETGVPAQVSPEDLAAFETCCREFVDAQASR